MTQPATYTSELEETRVPRRLHLLQYGMMVEEVVNIATVGIVEAASQRRLTALPARDAVGV